MFGTKMPPMRAEFALETNALIRNDSPALGVALSKGAGQARFPLQPERRGSGQLRQLWVRWQGPLGLVWKQHVERLDATVPIIPNLESVKEEAFRLFQRNALFGLNMQRDIGSGAEFHALRDFRAGMDRRTIDWKQSLRTRPCWPRNSIPSAPGEIVPRWILAADVRALNGSHASTGRCMRDCC
jgi:uncharacterized protein (DUF58 family)